jgi:hypothetical protein
MTAAGTAIASPPSDVEGPDLRRTVLGVRKESQDDIQKRTTVYGSNVQEKKWGRDVPVRGKLWRQLQSTDQYTMGIKHDVKSEGSTGTRGRSCSASCDLLIPSVVSCSAVSWKPVNQWSAAVSLDSPCDAPGCGRFQGVRSVLRLLSFFGTGMRGLRNPRQ